VYSRSKTTNCARNPNKRRGPWRRQAAAASEEQFEIVDDRFRIVESAFREKDEAQTSCDRRADMRSEGSSKKEKEREERESRRAYRRRTRRKKSMGVMAKERENQVSEEKPDVESETKKKKKKSFRPLSRLSKLYLRRETRTRPISQVLALFPTSRALSFGPGSCVHQQQLCRQLPLQLR